MNHAVGRRIGTAVVVLALLAGAAARLNVLRWNQPWVPHQADEHILGAEALALWEGITPREVGWPGSTTRLAFSGVAAVEWFAQDGRRAWNLRTQPDQALALVSDWIGHRFVDTAPLYRTGRTLSLITGMMQLVVLVWALRQWVGPLGTGFGTLGVAIGPLAVAYSQYVLADVTALLFATILVGLAATPTPRRVLIMAVLAGLASASKYHFALWGLSAVIGCLVTPTMPLSRRLLICVVAAGVGLWTLVTFVPWTWLNPLLAMKEFAGVVLVKIGEGPPFSHALLNLQILAQPLGALTLAGAFASVLSPRRGPGATPAIVLVLPCIIGLLVLEVSHTVFDRYGLVLLPGLAILSGIGWERWLEHGSRIRRQIGLVALIACLALTVAGLINRQRDDADAPPDALVAEWLQAHVPPGARIALFDEDNVPPQRTEAQLQECVAFARTPAAYIRKWGIEGVDARQTTNAQPMRSLILTDEDFAAYQCARELGAPRGPGYYIVGYHREPRFDALLESDVIADFISGQTGRSGGVDVLVLDTPIPGGARPAAVIRARRGQRFIYTREAADTERPVLE